MKLHALTLHTAQLAVAFGAQLNSKNSAPPWNDSWIRSFLNGGKPLIKNLHALLSLGEAPKGVKVNSTEKQRGELNSAVSGWPEVTRRRTDPKVVVTLTTTPSRLESLTLVLDSLLNQSYRPDEIHANIPFVSTRGLGRYPDLKLLESYKQRGVKIFRTQDWGTLTNILPTRQRLEAEKNRTLIIVVDDDKVLPSSMVADHVRAHRERPMGANACRGYKVMESMSVFGEGTLLLMNELDISVLGYRIAEEKRVGVVTGSDTWSVRADGFDESLWSSLTDTAPSPWQTMQIGELAMLMNDIWVSGLLSKASRPKYVMPCTQQAWDVPKRAIHANDSIGFTLVMPGNKALPEKLRARDSMNAVVMEYFERDWKKEEFLEMEG